MKIKAFLQEIADYTIVNKSLIKRILPKHLEDHERNDIRRKCNNLVSRLKEEGLVVPHVYTENGDFVCYSLSARGFAVLGIDHTPDIHFSQGKSRKICNINHLRCGITQELSTYPNTKLETWYTGGHFTKRPLLISHKKYVVEGDHDTRHVQAKEYFELYPKSAFIVRTSTGTPLLFFIEQWWNERQLQQQSHHYYLYNKRKLYQKDFGLPENTGVRVLWILPHIHMFGWHRKLFAYLSFGKQSYFIPKDAVYVHSPLQSAMWITHEGRTRTLLKHHRLDDEDTRNYKSRGIVQAITAKYPPV